MCIKKKNEKYVVILLCAVSLLTTVIGSLFSGQLNSLYLSRNAFYGDTSSYYYMQGALYNNVKQKGKLNVIKNEFRNNSRNPLKTIPIVALAPSKLITVNGHLYLAAVMLFCMLALLSYTVFKRTGSLLYSLSSIFAFFLADNFFHPVKGFAGNYMDLHASFLGGAAIYALLLSDRGKKTWWLSIFGIFGAFTALTRFVAAGYLFFICFPVLIYFLILRYKQEKSVKNIFWRLLVVGAPIAIFAGYYLMKFTFVNLKFYSIAGYALNNNLSTVIFDFIRLYKIFMGTTGLGILVLVFMYYTSLYWKNKVDLASFIITLWIAAAQIILVVFILKVGDDWLTFCYAIPGVLLLLFAPFELKKDIPGNLKIINNKIFNVGFIFLVLWASVQHYHRIQIEAMYPSADAYKKYCFQKKITSVLLSKSGKYFNVNNHSRIPVFDTFFYEYGRNIANESLIMSKRSVLWRSYFNVHEGGWKIAYPNADMEEIKEKVYKAVLKDLDFIFIISDPQGPKAKYLFNNKISIEVVKSIYSKLLADSDKWKHEMAGKSEYGFDGPWGEFHIFRNIERTKGKVLGFLKDYRYEISNIESPKFKAGIRGKIGLKIENTSSSDWQVTAESGIHAFYYWLNNRGEKGQIKNINFKSAIEAGGVLEKDFLIDTPEISGGYELVISMVHENHAFFDNHGNKPFRKKFKIK